jgi:DNA-binding winged helix-turn-helix (wHTH) protein
MEITLGTANGVKSVHPTRGWRVASTPAGTQESIRFGEDFEVDLRAFELRHLARPLKLERLPLQVLVILIEQKGQLVTREEIAEKIWGKDVFVDTDNSINGAVRKIRQALKDDPQQPRYVETLSGRGYRFIAPVSDASQAPLQFPAAKPQPSEKNSLAELPTDPSGQPPATAADLLLWPRSFLVVPSHLPPGSHGDTSTTKLPRNPSTPSPSFPCRISPAIPRRISSPTA